MSAANMAPARRFPLSLARLRFKECACPRMAGTLATPRESGVGEIIDVRPQIEVLSLAVDSSAGFRSRIPG